MANRTPFVVGEWYHCYNRGTEKRRILHSGKDYQRFIALLYLCNGTNKIRMSDMWEVKFEEIFTSASINRGEKLADIAAYCLMPNHIHLVMRETREGGIASFMQRVFTAYTMYFNAKYRRSGPLFSGVFKSRHVDDDRYFKQVISYVLLNPAELFEPKWKEGIGNIHALEKQLMQYPYANMVEFLGNESLTKNITVDVSREYYDTPPSLPSLLSDAQEYYREHEPFS
jgi:putative transposase